MANGFSNSLVNVNGGCGAGAQLPAYATYQLSAGCANQGIGVSSYPAQSQALNFALPTPIPTVSFATSTATRRVFFGSPLPAESRCLVFVQAVTGFTTLTDAFDGADTTNSPADAFFCNIENDQALIGLVAHIDSGDVSSLRGTQVVAQICSPVYSSDIKFQGVSGCSGECDFTASNLLVGDNAWFIVTIPAGVAITFDICSCTTEDKTFSGCQTGTPNIAQVPVNATCPTY